MTANPMRLSSAFWRRRAAFEDSMTARCNASSRADVRSEPPLSASISSRWTWMPTISRIGEEKRA